MGRVLASVVLVLLPSLSFAAAPVVLRDNETIVFYGDSITSRTCTRRISRRSCSRASRTRSSPTSTSARGGDTASGGKARFARDVAGVTPSLVFTNFGMNDGGYKAYDEAIYRSYLDAQRALADTIRNSGARRSFSRPPRSTTCCGAINGVYNEMLSRMARGVIALAAERQLPVIDLLHPMVEIQRQAKAKEPGFTMIPDTVHPDPAATW